MGAAEESDRGRGHLDWAGGRNDGLAGILSANLHYVCRICPERKGPIQKKTCGSEAVLIRDGRALLPFRDKKDYWQKRLWQENDTYRTTRQLKMPVDDVPHANVAGAVDQFKKILGKNNGG